MCGTATDTRQAREMHTPNTVAASPGLKRRGLAEKGHKPSRLLTVGARRVLAVRGTLQFFAMPFTPFGDPGMGVFRYGKVSR